MANKICYKCQQSLDISLFHKHSKNKDGLQAMCCQCKAIIQKNYHNNPINKQKEQDKYNSEKEKEKRNTEEYKKKHAQSQKKHLQYPVNKSKHYNSRLEWHNNMYTNNDFYRLKVNSRNLIKDAFYSKGIKKESKTAELLCCSLVDFQTYLGAKPGENYQLDHICPCAQAQNKEELIKLQHYSNFRWLLADENLKKSNHRVPEAEQKCFDILGREWIDG